MEYYKNLQLQDIKYIDDDGIQKLEIWKDIPGYEKLYKVSDLARVKSMFYRGTKKEGILTQTNAGHGYLHVSLHKENKGSHIKVQILVAMAFLGHIRCGHLKVVDHKFQDRKDNRLSMIQIITQRKNTNKKHISSSSKHTGVYFHNLHKRWYSAIRILKEKIHLGSFDKEEDAATAYNLALSNWDNYGIKPEKKKFGSIYRGVTYFKSRDKWVAKIKINGKLKHVGIFKTEIEAHYAFEDALLKNPTATA